MTLKDVTEEIIYIEEYNPISNEATKAILDGWIHWKLAGTEYHQWWGNFIYAAPYHIQVETLKLKGIV